jgi:hypothetical protein
MCRAPGATAARDAARERKTVRSYVHTVITLLAAAKQQHRYAPRRHVGVPESGRGAGAKYQHGTFDEISRVHHGDYAHISAVDPRYSRPLARLVWTRTTNNLV